ncbi:HTH-type transcriptional regulator GntR [Labrenzia sp. THAF82]|uniref:LacI family DNA-binding transcriptional regulator n=1 Tax=Labrenzia sp. THAF82 TaxID=2587861 RepID=UPI0012A9EC4F|nr:LacI family DNA-binding transcriptional regulator [Labrenzia sp. THAF82]QFT34518.1 HTH-type transcriptional regulator GntR [Labrenzia sp. THAF82]
MTEQSGKPSPVTMRDVAKAAGVSRMTVSRALRKDSPVSPETRAHILKIVRDMNYVPDQMAGSLTTKKSGFVATLLPSLNNLHFALTVQSLTEELEEIGLQILLGHTAYSADREEELLETMLRRRPEAIVLSYDGHTDRTRRLMEDAAVPVVEIWEKPDRPIAHTVGFSNFEAAKKMTEQVIAKGYERIAFVGESQDDWTRGAARRMGFVSAMEHAGLDCHRLIGFGMPPLSIESGAAAASQLMRDHPDTQCLICVSDVAAFGAQSWLLSQGYKIPGDIAVAGFGNFEVSRFATPSISTVVVNPEGIGRETGKLLKKLFSSSDPLLSAPQHIDVPATVAFRQSC